jgi:protocatechuate 3,4-dioxygenase alpha subunit
MNQLPVTPSQTVGPFFAYGLTAHQYGYPYTSLLNDQLTGLAQAPILITGQIFDGQGNVISDAMIECWQADQTGQYRSSPIPFPDQPDSFKGIGRLGTGTTADFGFAFRTCKPGPTGPGQAPHINIILFMRGSLRTLYTRLYFADETEANVADELLQGIPEHRRHTLLAQPNGNGQYQFNIVMQGERETVFLDL